MEGPSKIGYRQFSFNFLEGGYLWYRNKKKYKLFLVGGLYFCL